MHNEDIVDQPVRAERSRLDVTSISEEIESPRSPQDVLIEIVERRRRGGKPTPGG